MVKNVLESFETPSGVKVNVRSTEGRTSFSSKGFTKLVLLDDKDSDFFVAKCPTLRGTGAGIIRIADKNKAARKLLRAAWNLDV